LLFRVAEITPIDDTLPSYMTSIRAVAERAVPQDRYAVLNFGSKFPIYSPPPGFVLRLGASPTDFFLTGTFVRMVCGSDSFASDDVAAECCAGACNNSIRNGVLHANTDGADNRCDAQSREGLFLRRISGAALHPDAVPNHGFEIRSTGAWLFSFASLLTSAQLSNAPPQIIQNLQNNYDEVLRAYNEERGRSAPVSLNSTGSLTLNPSLWRTRSRFWCWWMNSPHLERTCSRPFFKTTIARHSLACERWVPAEAWSVSMLQHIRRASFVSRCP
jgi:hypothetical protein